LGCASSQQCALTFSYGLRTSLPNYFAFTPFNLSFSLVDRNLACAIGSSRLSNVEFIFEQRGNANAPPVNTAHHFLWFRLYIGLYRYPWVETCVKALRPSLDTTCIPAVEEYAAPYVHSRWHCSINSKRDLCFGRVHGARNVSNLKLHVPFCTKRTHTHKCNFKAYISRYVCTTIETCIMYVRNR
jgi:hypothetical protein